MSTVLGPDRMPGTTVAAVSPRRDRPRRGLRRLWPVLVSIVLVPVCLIWIYPFLWVVGGSFRSNRDVFSSISIFTQQVHLENYVRAWRQAHIGQYFLNTVFVTVTSIVITVISVALMGYALGRYSFPGKKIIIGLLAAAIFLPEGYTIIPVVDLLQQLHLSRSLWGITLAESGGAHIVSLLLYMGYFSQLPKELEEAAKLDGAGFLRTFASVYLPLATPVTATAIILQFMHSWNDFLLPLVLTLNRPDMRTLSVGIYSFQGDYGTDWTGLLAASTLSIIPIVVIFLFLQRYFVEGIAGAVK